MVALWAERFAALGAREDVAYVLEFENRGAQVGATIAHPHGQIYAYDEVPDMIAAELSHVGALAAEWASVSTDHEELVVARSGEWMAWIPEAAIYPFELRVGPEDALPRPAVVPGDVA